MTYDQMFIFAMIVAVVSAIVERAANAIEARIAHEGVVRRRLGYSRMGWLRYRGTIMRRERERQG